MINYILLIAVSVGVLYVGFLLYGGAKFEAGKALGTQESTQAAVSEAIEAPKRLEKIHNETSKINDDALDVELVGLGILRDDKDR